MRWEGGREGGREGGEVLAFFCVSLLGGNTDLENFAFLVGAFPSGKSRENRGRGGRREGERERGENLLFYFSNLSHHAAPTVSVYGLRYCSPSKSNNIEEEEREGGREEREDGLFPPSPPSTDSVSSTDQGTSFLPPLPLFSLDLPEGNAPTRKAKFSKSVLPPKRETQKKARVFPPSLPPSLPPTSPTGKAPTRNANMARSVFPPNRETQKKARTGRRRVLPARTRMI